jgi:diguanylate cyclase (GGDEF)-like protein
LAASETSSILAEDVDRWLAAGFRWREWRFPRRLQAQFDSDTRAERSKTAGLTSLLGAAVGLTLYPVLLAAAPDLHNQAALLFLGVAIPFTLLMSVLVLRNPAPLLREIMLALPVAVDASVLTYLFRHTAANATELYVAATILVLVYTTVTVQVRFPVAVAVTAYVFVIYALSFIIWRPAEAQNARFLVALTGAIASYLLAGNWRLHADQRRGYVLMLRERLRQDDLTARNRALDELSRRDPLTGLANRRAYDVWLEDLWLDAAAYGQPLGLIMIDIDRFKAFNDVNGHPAGDACLRSVADCLQAEIAGQPAYVARLGGEEFAVLLPGQSIDACAMVAERLRRAAEALAVRHPALGAGRVITISAGVAAATPAPGTGVTELCAAADAALYRAKQSGRNRVRVAGEDSLPGAIGTALGSPSGTSPGLPKTWSMVGISAQPV